MRRVVSVWFPTLPTDRLRQPKEGQRAAHPLTGSKGLRPFAGPGQRPGLPHPGTASRTDTGQWSDSRSFQDGSVSR